MSVIVSPVYQRDILVAEAPGLAAIVEGLWVDVSTGFEPRCEMPTARETVELFRRTHELLRITNASLEAIDTIETLLRTQRADAIDLAQGEVKSAHAFVKESILRATNETTTHNGVVVGVLHADWQPLSRDCITQLNAALTALRMAEEICREAYALPYE